MSVKPLGRLIMRARAVGCALAVLGLGAADLAAQRVPAPQQTSPNQAGAGGIQTYHVRENVWMLITPDGNLALQVGPDGALLVDTGRSGTSDAVLAAIRQITTQPLRYIINTSAAPVRIGNNEVLGALPGGATDRKGAGPGPAIIAKETVLSRLSTPGPQAVSAAGWPSDAYVGRRRSIHYNGEAIDIIYQPSAYSDGDSIVHFRRYDVIVAGEIFSTKRFPLVDREHGGTVTGVLAGLNQIEDMSVADVIADNFAEDGTLIIPGSGRLCDKDDLTEYRDMVHILRERIAKNVSKGNSLDAVKTSRPMIDYEGRFSIPDWTTAMFTEALYAELAHSSGSTAARAAAK